MTVTASEVDTIQCVEELISFPSGERVPLAVHGVLHRPAGARATTWVVLLGGWSGTRVGPHGILVAAARALVAAGYFALRFDYRGRGDSEGAQSAAHIGTMAEDARTAVSFLRESAEVEQVILLGICAGAQVGVAACPGMEGLAGLVLWSPPPLHPDTPPPARRPRHLREYVRKLFDSRTWAKLLGGKLQWRTIALILLGRRIRAAPPVGSEDWAGPKPDEQIYEEALKRVRAPALFVFGTSDPEAREAEAYYGRLRHPDSATRFHHVEGANHSFYSLAWKEEVIGVSLDWIQSTCAASST